MDEETTMRIGILGGTFNPVHIGHLILAQDALEKFELAKVLLMPCATPPHKNAVRLVAAEHRLRMLEAAVEGDLRLEAAGIEVERGGISYTVDTLRTLCALHRNVRWHLILGSDSLLELYQWKEVYSLLELCEVVSLARPGSGPDGIAAEALHLKPPWPQRLLLNLTVGHRVEVSSSDVRRRVAEGLSIRYLVHPAVEMYIAEHGLYSRA